MSSTGLPRTVEEVLGQWVAAAVGSVAEELAETPAAESGDCNQRQAK
jgi:hypothetical protein